MAARHTQADAQGGTGGVRTTSLSGPGQPGGRSRRRRELVAAPEQKAGAKGPPGVPQKFAKAHIHMRDPNPRRTRDPGSRGAVTGAVKGAPLQASNGQDAQAVKGAWFGSVPAGSHFIYI